MIKRKPLIYIAGPYTNPDPVENTHRAIRIGLEVYGLGGMPYIPHLSMFMHFIEPREIDFWYEYDLDILAHCDALYRFDGASTGADNEVNAAVELGLDVFYEQEGPNKLETFIATWSV